MLYHLENHELPCGAKFSNHSGAQEYVNFITATTVWTENSNLPRFVKVYSFGDLDYSESRQPNEIWLCNTHLNQQVVLHELSHFFRPEANHGPAFVNFYFLMLRTFMGSWYADIYRDAFRREGIKF